MILSTLVYLPHEENIRQGIPKGVDESGAPPSETRLMTDGTVNLILVRNLI